MHYNYFRDYDPAIGRYVQSDPIGLRGGINTFEYVRSGPLSRVDLYGLREPPEDGSGRPRWPGRDIREPVRRLWHEFWPQGECEAQCKTWVVLGCGFAAATSIAFTGGWGAIAVGMPGPVPGVGFACNWFFWNKCKDGCGERECKK
jgi:hypothetical protein